MKSRRKSARLHSQGRCVGVCRAIMDQHKVSGSDHCTCKLLRALMEVAFVAGARWQQRRAAK